MQVGKAVISAAIVAGMLGGATTATAAEPAPKSKAAAKCGYEKRPGGGWLDCWKTKKGTQKSAAHKVKKGKHFFHFGIKGNNTRWTASVYKKVKGKDIKVHSLKGKANNTEAFTSDKKYSAGSYYIVWKYGKTGSRAFGGIE
ncbi:hypothetical protein ACWGH7_04390 [Streptomyces cyaneofuscatus]|uniref:hypothetical protein n=1 Tax=Streptomyces TaxID=1883 RepID=UPI0004C4E3D5|nr:MULTISPECIES: hypothetical protein [Streptomyces]ONI52254.1 hypothetical protein STIB_36510 [Streptomyces sp. IB2014 011-1]RDV50593.1 hypothetical protein DDV98_17980 [Streptomyces sp. IB2014 011-12]CAD5968440.1 conserved exported protein of unknown function [Streptomyces sp. KY75]CAD5975346.1 conserved exported protein of unknown function [Streptomyces sp. KY70]